MNIVEDKRSAVIYARVSSVGERQSAERQIADLREYAQKNGLKVVEVFEEHASGAKSIKERSVLQRCFDRCERDCIREILVWELSRLGRNVWDLHANIKWCLDHRINIRFFKEGLSLIQGDGSDNPMMPILVSVLATCAAMERDNITRRLQSGRERYIEKGGKLGRPAGTTLSLQDKAEKYQGVLRELRRGTSVRRAAKLCDVSPSTVQRLKKEFNL